jgi:uncharacterized protein YgiB involved in biofilm formation
MNVRARRGGCTGRGERVATAYGIVFRIALSQSVLAEVRSRGAVLVPRPGRLRYYARAMRTRSRKSSARVTLVLLGAAALAGCGSSGDSDGNLRRDVYASKEDCVADWGDPKDCEGQPAQSSGGRSGYWYGPAYRGGGGTLGGSAPRANHSLGNQSISRGGFGGSGHAHSSGGS